MKFPEWVNFEDRNINGERITKSGNNYFAYRVYRQRGGNGVRNTVHESLGLTLPGNGCIPEYSFLQEQFFIREYGFSAACLHMAPLTWKNNSGEDWFDILTAIVLDMSPNSFLKDFEHKAYESRDLGWKRHYLEAGMGHQLEELRKLFEDMVLVIDGNGNKVVAGMTPAHQDAAAAIGFSFERTVHSHGVQ